jgi:hypothetical protein
MISRARIMRFRSLPNGELYKLLKGVSEDDSEFILHLAQGAPGIVALLRDDPDRLREQRLVQTAARSFWKSRSNRERLQLLNPLSQRGEKSEEFLLHLALALREQSPSLPLPSVQALGELSRDLQTNAHRGLLVQRFVSSV